jgi:hypothetical protein
MMKEINDNSIPSNYFYNLFLTNHPEPQMNMRIN